MKNIFVIVGESSSGKSTLAKKICNSNTDIELLVTTTSRPIRVDEVDRKDYHFLSEEQFKEMVQLKKFVEYASFRGWYYGLSKNTIYDCDSNNMLVVLNPSGLRSLLETLDKREYKIIPLYIYASEKVRLIRSLYRGGDVNEILRRFHADRLDFQDIPHLVLENDGYIVRNDKLLENTMESLMKMVNSCLEESNYGWN